MTTSDQINELAVALCKAQAAMKPALKDATNPAFRSRYADLAAVWESCRGPLTANGITVWQDVTLADRGVSVTTRLVHGSGQWVEFGPLTVPLTKQDAQGVGSATSYGKRYALSAALGIVAEEDDDGNAATARTAAAPPATVASRAAGSVTLTPAGLRQLCLATGTPVEKVAQHYDVETVDDLTPAQLAEACAKLAKKAKAA